jgi:hypothetical protein
MPNCRMDRPCCLEDSEEVVQWPRSEYASARGVSREAGGRVAWVLKPGSEMGICLNISNEPAWSL